MLENKQPAVDEVAEQAKLLIDALFNDRVARVTVSVEEEEEEEKPRDLSHLVFELSKDGEANYEFMTANRISQETMEDFMEVVYEVMSICPNLTEDNTELILNVFANHLDLAQRMFAENYNEEVAHIMTQASNSVSHDYIIIAGKVFNSPEAFAKALGEVDERIEAMIEHGDAQEKVTAIGLRTLEGEYRIFGYLMNKYCKMQYGFLTAHFPTLHAHQHVRTQFQLNRLSRIVCEVLCILYQQTGNK